jgi:hypothetical protein
LVISGNFSPFSISWTNPWPTCSIIFSVLKLLCSFIKSSLFSVPCVLECQSVFLNVWLQVLLQFYSNKGMSYLLLILNSIRSSGIAGHYINFISSKVNIFFHAQATISFFVHKVHSYYLQDIWFSLGTIVNLFPYWSSANAWVKIPRLIIAIHKTKLQLRFKFLWIV